MACSKQKTEIFLVTRLPTSWKFDSCFLASVKGQSKDKSEFVTKFRNDSSLKFHVKCLLQVVFETENFKQNNL